MANDLNAPPAPLRLRCKVWTDNDGHRYLVAVGFHVRDTGFMRMVAMSDEKTVEIRITTDEWNALPFFYFEQRERAPAGPILPL